MGSRRNIKLDYRKITNEEDTSMPIYFYTHWGARTLAKVLQNALIRGESRWNDESYLARVIFSEMIMGDINKVSDIKDNLLELTGYGIAPYECDPEYSTINVDMLKQTVNGIPYSTFITMDIFDYWPEDDEDED